jgi:DNA primase
MQYALTSALSELLGVDIKERGVNALLLCPFHSEDSPSFSIHLNEGLWQCFGCGEKGGVNKLYRMLGKQVTDEIYQNRLISSINNECLERKDFTSLSRRQASAISASVATEAISAYLKDRPISRSVISAFSIGWSQEKMAISMPYIDDDRVTGIKYRHASGMKTSETGSYLGMYGVNNVRGKANVIICEGESDTHAMWSLMKGNQEFGVAGISGGKHDKKAWSLWAIDMMFAKKVYIALDADDVGDAGYQTAESVLGTEKCVRIRPTHGKDVCDHIMNGGNFAELGLEG